MRAKWREGNIAGMFAGLLLIVLMIAAVLGSLIFVTATKMTVPTPVPGQETPEAK